MIRRYLCAMGKLVWTKEMLMEAEFSLSFFNQEIVPDGNRMKL